MAKTKSKMAPEVMAESASNRWKPAHERKSGPFEDYEVESALETIAKAEKIKKNRALMAAVRTKAREQLAALQQTTKSL